jgi:hypothetical protein
MKARVIFVAGVLAGVIGVVAFHQGGVAHASPNSCNAWQVTEFSSPMCDLQKPPCGMMGSWEPFAVRGNDIVVRRCVQ